MSGLDEPGEKPIVDTNHITHLIRLALAPTTYMVKGVIPVDGGWRWDLMDMEFGAIVGDDRSITVTEAELVANEGRGRLSDLIRYKIEEAIRRRPEAPPEPVMTQIVRWMNLTRGLVWRGSSSRPESASHLWTFEDPATGRKVTVLVTDIDIVDDRVDQIVDRLEENLAKDREQGDDPPADVPPMD